MPNNVVTECCGMKDVDASMVWSCIWSYINVYRAIVDGGGGEVERTYLSLPTGDVLKKRQG